MNSIQRIAVGTLLGAVLLAVCIPVFAASLGCLYQDPAVSVGGASRDPSFRRGTATNCGAAAGASCSMPYGLTANSTIEGTATMVAARRFVAQMNITSFALAGTTPQATKVLGVGETLVCRTHQFSYAMTAADANAFCVYFPLFAPDMQDCLSEQNWMIDQSVAVAGWLGIAVMWGLGFVAGVRR